MVDKFLAWVLGMAMFCTTIGALYRLDFWVAVLVLVIGPFVWMIVGSLVYNQLTKNDDITSVLGIPILSLILVAIVARVFTFDDASSAFFGVGQFLFITFSILYLIRVRKKVLVKISSAIIWVDKYLQKISAKRSLSSKIGQKPFNTNAKGSQTNTAHESSSNRKAPKYATDPMIIDSLRSDTFTNRCGYWASPGHKDRSNDPLFALITDLGQKERKDGASRTIIDMIKRDQSIVARLIILTHGSSSYICSEIVSVIIAASSLNDEIKKTIATSLMNENWPDTMSESVAVKIIGMIRDPRSKNYLQKIVKDEKKEFVVRFWANLSLDNINTGAIR